MSPTTEHEEYKDFILRIAHILAEELVVALEPRGSSTFKRKRLLKGTEPDGSFCVQNAAAVVGKRRINLSIDPPPDVVVEIDISTESLSKFPIYAVLGVPEIWRYDGKQACIYHLADEDYVEAPASRSFHGLTAQAITESIDKARRKGNLRLLQLFGSGSGPQCCPEP